MSENQLPSYLARKAAQNPGLSQTSAIRTAGAASEGVQSDTETGWLQESPMANTTITDGNDAWAGTPQITPEAGAESYFAPAVNPASTAGSASLFGALPSSDAVTPLLLTQQMLASFNNSQGAQPLTTPAPAPVAVQQPVQQAPVPQPVQQAPVAQPAQQAAPVAAPSAAGGLRASMEGTAAQSADGASPEMQAAKQVQSYISKVKKAQKDQEGKQGIFGKFVGGTKNLFNTKNSSDKVDGDLTSLQKDGDALFAAARSGDTDKFNELYEKVTGQPFGQPSADGAVGGELKEKGFDRVQDYQKSQSTWTNALIITGAVLIGAALTPFTGGLSLAAVGTCAAISAGSAVALTGLDDFSADGKLDDGVARYVGNGIGAAAGGAFAPVGEAVGGAAGAAIAGKMASGAAGELAGDAVGTVAGQGLAKAASTGASEITGGTAGAATGGTAGAATGGTAGAATGGTAGAATGGTAGAATGGTAGAATGGTAGAATGGTAGAATGGTAGAATGGTAGAATGGTAGATTGGTAGAATGGTTSAATNAATNTTMQMAGKTVNMTAKQAFKTKLFVNGGRNAVSGAVQGSGTNVVNTALHGGSVSDMAKAGLFGAVAGGAMAGGGSVAANMAGKAGGNLGAKFLNGKAIPFRNGKTFNFAEEPPTVYHLSADGRIQKGPHSDYSTEVAPNTLGGAEKDTLQSLQTKVQEGSLKNLSDQELLDYGHLSIASGRSLNGGEIRDMIKAAEASKTMGAADKTGLVSALNATLKEVYVPPQVTADATASTPGLTSRIASNVKTRVTSARNAWRQGTDETASTTAGDTAVGTGDASVTTTTGGARSVNVGKYEIGLAKNGEVPDDSFINVPAKNALNAAGRSPIVNGLLDAAGRSQVLRELPGLGWKERLALRLSGSRGARRIGIGVGGRALRNQRFYIRENQAEVSTPSGNTATPDPAVPASASTASNAPSSTATTGSSSAPNGGGASWMSRVQRAVHAFRGSDEAAPTAVAPDPAVTPAPSASASAAPDSTVAPAPSASASAAPDSAATPTSSTSATPDPAAAPGAIRRGYNVARKAVQAGYRTARRGRTSGTDPASATGRFATVRNAANRLRGRFSRNRNAEGTAETPPAASAPAAAENVTASAVNSAEPIQSVASILRRRPANLPVSSDEAAQITRSALKERGLPDNEIRDILALGKNNFDPADPMAGYARVWSNRASGLSRDDAQVALNQVKDDFVSPQVSQDEAAQAAKSILENQTKKLSPQEVTDILAVGKTGFDPADPMASYARAWSNRVSGVSRSDAQVALNQAKDDLMAPASLTADEAAQITRQNLETAGLSKSQINGILSIGKAHFNQNEPMQSFGSAWYKQVNGTNLDEVQAVLRQGQDDFWRSPAAMTVQNARMGIRPPESVKDPSSVTDLAVVSGADVNGAGVPAAGPSSTASEPANVSVRRQGQEAIGQHRKRADVDINGRPIHAGVASSQQAEAVHHGERVQMQADEAAEAAAQGQTGQTVLVKGPDGQIYAMPSSEILPGQNNSMTTADLPPDMQASFTAANAPMSAFPQAGNFMYNGRNVNYGPYDPTTSGMSGIVPAVNPFTANQANSTNFAGAMPNSFNTGVSNYAYAPSETGFAPLGTGLDSGAASTADTSTASFLAGQKQSLLDWGNEG